jgi:hypothetical protein
MPNHFFCGAHGRAITLLDKSADRNDIHDRRAGITNRCVGAATARPSSFLRRQERTFCRIEIAIGGDEIHGEGGEPLLTKVSTKAS